MRKLTTFPILLLTRDNINLIKKPRLGNVYAICVLLTGCAAIPEKTVEVKIPIAVTVPCKTNIPKPEVCVPKEGRVEWLRCALVDRERNQAYIKQLEAALAVCAE